MICGQRWKPPRRRTVSQIALSQPIIDETMRVLKNKFGWLEAELRDGLLVMESCTTKISPLETVTAVLGDPTDDRILQCAVAGRSEFLISGDKHLLKLGSFRRVKIVKTVEFLALGRSK
jgi:uncharacterized protein